MNNSKKYSNLSVKLLASVLSVITLFPGLTSYASAANAKQEVRSENSIVRKIKDVGSRANSLAKRGWIKISTWVRNHPKTTIAIGVTIGVAIIGTTVGVVCYKSRKNKLAAEEKAKKEAEEKAAAEKAAAEKAAAEKEAAEKEAARKAAEGQSEVVEGQSEVVEGQPEVVEGQPEVVEGKPEVVEGQPEVVEGQPEVVEGQPEVVEGQPEVVEGQPEVVEGQPEVVEGQPEVVEGQSEVVEGQPEVVEGQPEVVEGQPEVVEGQPEVVEEQSEVATEQPEKTTEQPEEKDEKDADASAGADDDASADAGVLENEEEAEGQTEVKESTAIIDSDVLDTVDLRASVGVNSKRAGAMAMIKLLSDGTISDADKVAPNSEEAKVIIGKIGTTLNALYIARKGAKVFEGVCGQDSGQIEEDIETCKLAMAKLGHTYDPNIRYDLYLN